jgi:hypothetical protein
MEQTATSTSSTAAPTAAPVATAVPTPTPAPVPSPPPAANPITPMPPTTTMATGGNVGSSSFKDIFKDINWVDTGIMMVGLAALYYNIYYYRLKIKNMKQEYPEICNRLDAVETEVANVKQQQKAKATVARRRNPF